MRIKRERLGITLTPQLVRKIKEEASKRGMPVSLFIEFTLRESLWRNENVPDTK